MLLRQAATGRRGTTGATGQHGLDQHLARRLIDRTRPATRAQMDVSDLIIAQQINALTRTIEALRKVFASLILAVGQQLNGMETLLPISQKLQPRQDIALGKQEDVRTTIGIASRQREQRIERRIGQLFGIVDQQIHLLPGQRQLRHLRENAAHVHLLHAQPLGHLAQHATDVTGAARGNHHRLHRLLVGAGHQRLAQQRLAAAMRPGHYQQ